MKRAIIFFLLIVAVAAFSVGCGTSNGMSVINTPPAVSQAAPSTTTGAANTGTPGTPTPPTAPPTTPPPPAAPPPPSSTVPSTATVFPDIQAMDSWQSCAACAGAGGNGPIAPFSMTQHISSPSIGGNATQFLIGGSTPYSDVLWWRTLVNYNELPKNQAAHHFVYDLSYYMDNPGAAQAIEFDINQFVDGRSLIFGSQCDYRGDGNWDVWDNVNSHWISTGISCGTPAAFTWIHIVLEVERTSDNRLHYISLTINGSKHLLDWYYDSTATTWSGIDVNYQIDGNFKQENYSTWVDKMSLSAW